LRDVFRPVLEFRDENQTFAKVEGPKVDFFLSRIADLDRFKPRAGLGRIWGLAKVETLGLEPGPALTRLGCPLMKNGNNLISSHFTFILFFLIFFDKIDL